MAPQLTMQKICRILLLFACSALWNPPARAADTWTEVKCPHFTVAGNAGEKDLRKICDQFELFRSMFKSAFPSLSIEPGTPIEIIAAKNEATMKELLPEQYETKGHAHFVGLYQPGPTRVYVVLQMNAEGQNPYHVLYHEYTHTLIHLNFIHVPLWLDEGVAEYLGNASLGDKEVRIGLVPEGHLYVLQQNRLLPLETLLAVDHSSPYYNEANRTSVFYAESWALVHYLMLDQRARQEHLLGKFLEAMTQTGDQVAAARATFGDLKKFGNTLDNYARMGNFYNGIIKPPTEALDKNYAVRTLSSSEAMALRGAFLVNHNRLQDAKRLLDEAAKDGSNNAAVHEGLGMYAFRTGNQDETLREMEEAIRLKTDSFAPYYIAAVSTLRMGRASEEDRKKAIENLNTAVKLNPNFAPGYDALASLLRMFGDRLEEALNAEAKAVRLDSSNTIYVMNFTYLLLSVGRDKDAQVMADRVAKTASTPQERAMAEQMMETVRDAVARKEGIKKAVAAEQVNAAVPSLQKSQSTDPAEKQPATVARSDRPVAPVPDSGKTIIERALYVVDGKISNAVCGENGEVIVMLDVQGTPKRYHIKSVDNVEVVEGRDKPAPDPTDCKAWSGRKVRVWFQRAEGKDYAGEVTKIYFE